MTNSVLDQDRVSFLKNRKGDAHILVPSWPRHEKELPRVQLEVQWVRFSTLNHRTRAEQMRETHRADKPDLFTADPLGPSAQDAQYRILKSQENFEALKFDLKERGQQDPAIVTAEGVLINGNRRTAALRSLYIDDKYLRAQYVDCLVLPEDATPAELLDLEAELQVARDFKEDYSWINEAMLIEELYDREGKDFERVAKRMHRDVKDVRSLHEKLQQVHQLVDMSNGAKLHIDFKDNESAFDELAKHIRNKSPAEADSVRETYFLGTLAGVNYRRLRHLRRADAAKLVRSEIDADASLQGVLKAIPAPEPTPLDDPLDEVLGTSDKPSELNDVLSFVAGKRPEEVIKVDGHDVTAKQILDTLQSAINAAADDAEEEAHDQTAVTAPIVRTAKAISELERALAALPRARALEGWDEQQFVAKMAAAKKLITDLESEA
jgi:hypothetical protein